MGVTKFEVGDVVRCVDVGATRLTHGQTLTVRLVDQGVLLDPILQFEEVNTPYFASRFELVRRAKDAKQMSSDWEVGDVLEYVGIGGASYGLVPRGVYKLVGTPYVEDAVDVETLSRPYRRLLWCPCNLFKNLTAAERAAKGALVGRDHREDAARYIGIDLGHEKPATIRGAIESGRLKLHPPTATAARILTDNGYKFRPDNEVARNARIEDVRLVSRCGACNAKLPTVPGRNPIDPLDQRGASMLDRSQPLGVFAFPLTDHYTNQENVKLCATCASSVAQHIVYLKTKNDGFDPDVD